MVETRYKDAKNYNFAPDMTLNTYVDAKDTVNHWCVGQICDVDEEKNQVKIHFEGWTSRYDEWMKKNSQKLAPFRRHTEGYTGQKKTAFRDFKISYAYQKQMQKQIQETIESDFKNFDTPNKLTQYIRGELYFYIDSLISLFNQTNSEDLPAIFEFMQDVFKLIFKWMEIFPQFIKSFYETHQHPQLYLTDMDAAIANCGNELFNILEKCFGGCPRCLKFLQRFGAEYIYEGEKIYANKDRIKGNGLMMSFINAFGNMGGFEKILQFISFETKDSKGKLSKGCPFILTMKALRPFISCLDYIDRGYSSFFAEQIQVALTSRLDNLQENEIKELDKDILRDTVEVMKYYIQVTDPANADQIAEIYELRIAQKYLRCPFFEKRVRGINELKEIYYKVRNASIRGRNADQYEMTKWLTEEKYAQWIINERILEFIFNENPHVELIKRSSEILRLLTIDEKYFSPDIIDMLWGCCREKHEDIVRATLDLIQDLAGILPLERLAQLFQKLQSIKESEFDEKLVNFIRNYTINTIKNIRFIKKGGDAKQGMVSSLLRGKKEIKIDENRYYDLSKFWLIFQDSNKISQKVKDLSLNSLIEILQDQEREAKESFIQLALDNIKRGDTFYSSIIFLRKIVNTYPLESQIRYKSSNTGPTVTTLLQDICKRMDLFDMIFQNVQDYMKLARSQLPLKMSKLAPGERLSAQNFVSQAPHSEYISVIINFIEFILVNTKVTLTFDHVNKMYNMFVVDAITEFETNIFYQLITKENEVAKTKERKFLLDDRVRNEVFQKIFCNNKYLNSEKINLKGFQCFKRLFLIVNEEEKTLEVQKEDRVVVTNLNQLQGMDTLWSIAIQCENQQVKDLCKDFLVDLYLKIRTRSNAQKKQIAELFPQKCLSYFKQVHERSDYQLSCLRLIKSFIARFDGEHIQEEDISKFDPKELKQIQVTLNPDKATIAVKVHPSQKFWQLKRKMANAFKLRLSEFFIKTKQGPLEESVYDEQLKDYKVESLHINRVPIDEMEREFPRYIIGYNEDYISQFLDLLKVGQEECKREVLTLLEILPINRDVKNFIRDNITKMPPSQQNINDWCKIFSWNSMDLGKSCYFLMSLEELMIPRRDIANPEQIQQDSQIKLEFCTKLIQSGGFIFLFEIYSQLDKKNLEIDVVRTKVLTILLKLITHLFGQKQWANLKQVVVDNHIQSLIYETLAVVESFIMTVLTQQKQGIPQNQERNVRLIRKDTLTLMNAYQFLTRALVQNPTMVNALYNYQQINAIVKTGLIEIDVESIQKLTFSFINDISQRLDLIQTISPKPSFFFMNIFINECLQFTLNTKDQLKTKNFFDLLNEIFNKTEMYADLHKIRPVLQLANEIAFIIFDREIMEMSARDEDVPLQGVFSFLKSIFIKFPNVRDEYQDRNKLLQYMIHDCLFHKETRSHMISKHKAMPPKCKNNVTRDKCLELLNELCMNNTEGIYILIRYLKNYIGETFWRTPRRGDWSISVHQQERSLTGFVGLKNIGCICYMNSIMQQLFMIPAFRKSILEVDDPNFGKEPNDDNVLYQLKMIFGGLMEIEKQYYNPKKFCSAFKDLDGSPIDPIVQKDVDEFFNQLMDKVENLTKGKKEEKIIKNLFQGVFANEFICKGCPHYSEREEPFLAINLQVKNKHSIKESLESFVEGEMLEGDNAYYCEKCEKKVNTLKRCCIKRMPNVLFMVLKRFEFNYDTMTKFKINDYCEFPMSINMSDYSKESLAKKDLLKQMEEKNLTLEDLDEEQREILEKAIPSKYYEYNLKGAVIHIGTAEQGHYITISQDRENPNGKWFEFNDDLVKQFDPQDIPDEAFGGDDDSFNINIQNYQGTNEQMMNTIKQLKTKIKNAYVLIYEREDIIDMEAFNEFIDNPQINVNKQEMAYRYDQCKLPKTHSSQIQIPLPIHESILEKNKKFWLSKFIFNKTYIDSVLSIFKTIQIEEKPDSALEYIASREVDLQLKSGCQLEIFKFLTTFFLTTVIRAKDRKTVPNFMILIREALIKNVGLSVWLLESFSNQDLIKELLIDCPIPDMKRFVAGLLKTAMEAVYKHEISAITEYCQQLDNGVLDFITKTQEQYIKHHRQIDMRQPTTKGETINTSPLCQNLNLFIMNHHNKNLPILIIFINSFIHLGVSQHYFKNQYLTGQFYQVFSHFVELGDQTRLYLLKTRQLGRLLDVYLNGDSSKSTSQLTEKFRNEAMQMIPLFQLDKELYMESNLEKNDVYLTFAEKKQAANSATAPYTFLAYTVSQLSRSCLFVKSQVPNPYALDNIQFVLDTDELMMVTNYKLDYWWNNSTLKVSRNAIADQLAHISFDNKEISLQILNIILENLQRVSFADYKIFERALIKLLLIKDQYQIDRTKKAMQALLDIMKANTQYYKDVDSMIDIIHKLASKSPIVVELLAKGSLMYRFIEQWSKEYPHFPLNQQKTKIFRQGILNWNSISSTKQGGSLVNQTTIDRVSQYTKERLQRIQALAQKEIPPNETAYDSDDDMYHHPFQEKEKLDFVQVPLTLDFFSDTMDNAYTGYIEIALDEMVRCVSDMPIPATQKPVTLWIETESDKLAPPHTLSSSEKRRIHYFYLNLLRNLANQGSN